jgi:ubiquinone/menaquinone biosynthesis C-methylase UbiE
MRCGFLAYGFRGLGAGAYRLEERGQCMADGDDFTPALGRSAWTGFYDLAIALMTREGRWRRAFLDQIAPRSGELIVDVGCGTGTLALALKQRAPGARVIGIDPDERVLALARRKAGQAGVEIEFLRAFARDASSVGVANADKAISSLVFHQTPIAEKSAGLAAMFALLRPGGELHVADYGLQRTALMRRLFRIVQKLDGFENTEPNALGVLPTLMPKCGFEHVAERTVVPTPSGSISIYFAEKPRPA